MMWAKQYPEDSGSGGALTSFSASMQAIFESCLLMLVDCAMIPSAERGGE